MPERSAAWTVWSDVLEQGVWLSVQAGIAAIPAGLVLTDTTTAAFWTVVGTGAVGGFVGWLTRVAQWRLTTIDSPLARRLAVK